ncbi:MAG: hypothetical protein J7M18_06400, partial [Candidatus Eremiobacteraeota bacterium]|nr:hypothetical protein [Candidatus Eremiobacteraeota bacterium]
DIRSHVKLNYFGNLIFFVKNHIHPVLITLLAIPGGWLLRKKKKSLVFLVVWFILGYLFYSSNPSCDISLLRTLDSWRISMYLYPPVLFLGGYCLSYIVSSRTTVLKILAGFVLVYLFLVPWQFWKFIDHRTVLMRHYEAMKIMSRHMGKDPVIFTMVSDSPGDRHGLPYMGRWAIPAPRIAPIPRDMGTIKKIAKNREVFLLIKGSLPGAYYQHLKVNLIEEQEVGPGHLILRLYQVECTGKFSIPDK